MQAIAISAIAMATVAFAGTLLVPSCISFDWD